METAAPIADLLGLPVRIDDRLRERMNWAGDGSQSLASFLREWATASADRTFVPSAGDSSLDAGRRFHEALDKFAAVHAGETIVIVTHGGVTVDLLRTLIGDGAVTVAAPTLIDDGVPNCAITRFEHRHCRWHVDQIACTHHLR